MHTLLHYYYTLILLGEPHASIAFAVDLEPAKTRLHAKLYRGMGVVDIVYSLPEKYRLGVAAHLVQDAYWDVFVRRNYLVYGNIWYHRMLETLWARKWAEKNMPRPPRIDIDVITEFLEYMGGTVKDVFMAERILWSIYGPLEEVEKILGIKSNTDPKKIDPSIIDKYFDEKALLALTSMLVGRLDKDREECKDGVKIP